MPSNLKALKSQLPFPKKRLERTTEVYSKEKIQIIDVHGSFVLTPVHLLPEGGQHIIRQSATNRLEVFLLGDLGKPSHVRETILKNVRQRSQKNHRQDYSKLMFGLGDLMYPYGPIDRSHEEYLRTKTTVLDALKPLAEDMPTYGILGNHEYGDTTQIANPGIFMDYANQAELQFPGRYYQLSIENQSFSVDFFALDTSTVPCDPDQVQWLHERVHKSCLREKQDQKKRWRILIGHHPMISYGFHHDETTYLVDLFQKSLARIDLYCAGHEHDLEFIQSSSKENIPPVLVSGTSSETRETFEGEGSLMSSSEHGFALLSFDAGTLSIEFIARDAKTPFFSHKITKNEV